MTATTETPQATKNPRDLISDELFGKLVARVMEEQPVSAAYAGVVVEQALVFLATIAANPNASMLTPSRAVDPGWHAFIAYTREYRDFCRDMTNGGFIHHIPVITADMVSGKSLERTITAMQATGYPVIPDMWQEWTSCGSTDNCNFFVEQAS